MHKPLFRIAVGSVAAVGGLLAASALPAGAATAVRAETMAFTAGPGTPESTPVTFTITSTGTLGITVPTLSVDLGGTPASTNVGTTIGSAGNFGPVAVTDNRALTNAIWTASVSATPFTNISGGGFIIPVGAATYTTGDVTATNGGGSAAPTPLGASGLTMSGAAQGVVSQTAPFDGDNGATWTPTIDVAVPANATIGIYTGIVTHSVA